MHRGIRGELKTASRRMKVITQQQNKKKDKKR